MGSPTPGCTRLAGLEKLRELDLTYTRTTEACLDRLAPLTELETLGLGCTLGPVGFKKLQRFPNLKLLQYTEARYEGKADAEAADALALQELRRALPDLRVNSHPSLNEEAADPR